MFAKPGTDISAEQLQTLYYCQTKFRNILPNKSHHLYDSKNQVYPFSKQQLALLIEQYDIAIQLLA